MPHGSHDPQSEFVPGKKSQPQKDSAFWERLWERFGTPLMVVSSVALLLLAGWLVTESQRAAGSSLAALSPAQAEELRQLSLRKEADFERRRLDKPVIDDGDIAVLGEAVQAQEDYLASRGALASENARLEALRRRYHVIQAERLRAAAVEAEEKSTALAKVDHAGAMRELRRALDAERLIESRWIFSGYADVGKIARLDTRYRRLEAEPLKEKGQQLEQEAEAAFKAGRFEEAIKRLGEAIEAEQTFVEKYRDVLETEFGRAERLATRQETMRSEPLFREIAAAEQVAREAIVRYEAAADPAALEKHSQAAAAAFDRAWSQQARLMQEYPRSTWATPARRTAFENQRNQWRSAAALRDISDRLRILAGHLRDGRPTEAVTLARELYAKLMRIEAENPGVIPADDPARRQLDYLSTHEAVLRAVLPQLGQLAIPVPGTSVRLMKQEVSQGFYSTVMGTNPSAVMRENLPVESVAYADAAAFCEALGWMSGRKVRLPTVAEYRAALGELAAPPERERAWTFDNTDGVTARPVGTSKPSAAGFYDLLGNVEEWALSEPADEAASVVGGSVNWVPVAGLPLRKALKREKSRTMGFRIVIE